MVFYRKTVLIIGNNWQIITRQFSKGHIKIYIQRSFVLICFPCWSTLSSLDDKHDPTHMWISAAFSVVKRVNASYKK